MVKEAEEKVDLMEAVKIGLMVTSSLTFALGVIYFIAYLEVIAAGLLGSVPFAFVVASLFVVFNLSFSFALLDQLRS